MVIDPIGPIGGDFAFPDRNLYLQGIDRITTGFEGFSPMRRGGDYDDRSVAYLQAAHAVGDRDPRAGPSLAGGLHDFFHFALGHLGVGLVFEIFDAMPARVIAHCTDERNDPAGIGRWSTWTNTERRWK